MSEWRIILTGHPYDLEDALKYFQSPNLSVNRDGSNFYFTSSRLNNMPESDYPMVRENATTLLAQLVAFARLKDKKFEPIKISGMEFVTESGQISQIISVEAIKSRFKIYDPLVRTNSSVLDSPELKQNRQREFLEKWLDLAEKDPEVSKALLLFGGLEPSFRNFYMVLEVIEDSLGGEKKLIKTNWVKAADIKEFKHTANSYAAIGIRARHATESISPPKQKMHISNAEKMIRRLLNRWIELKCSQIK